MNEEAQPVEAVTVEEAQLAIEADKRRRQERTAQRIQVILREERCDIVATPGITDGRVVARVEIVAR